MVKQILFAVVLASYVLSAEAVSLVEFRSRYQGSDRNRQQQIEAEANARRDALRLHLGTSTLARLASPANISTKDSYVVSSSNFFKGVLDQGAWDLLQAKKYSTPLKFDPSEFSYDRAKEMRQRKMQLCSGALKNENLLKKNLVDPNGYQVGSVEQLISTYYTSVVLAERNATDKRGASSAYTPPTKEESALLSSIESYLQSRPSILTRFGKPTRLKIFSGRVDRVYFSKQALSAPTSKPTDEMLLSLSMLANMRSGVDEEFVEIQQCLLAYMTREEQVFSMRLQDINRPFYEKWWGDKPWSQEEDTVYKLDLLYFLGKHSPDDKTFLQKHLGILRDSLPQLKAKVEGSVRAHSLLKDLPTEDLNFLISMFLDLRGVDLPSSSETNSMNECTYQASKLDIPRQDKDQMIFSMNYYLAMDRELSRLESALFEEVKDKLIRDEDRAIIRGKQ